MPLLPPPARASWAFIGASTVLQIAYYVLVAQVYRLADMGLAYPLMRGTAPLLVALGGVLIFPDPLPARAWIGTGIIAALRETSILFATVIAALVLHETVSRARLVGAFVIVIGAAALRLA